MDLIMRGPGRPRKEKTTATAVDLTPEPEVEVKELTLEDQHQKRTEIMHQMIDDLWYERQWDSEMAMQILRENRFDCPSHSLQIVQQVTKGVEIDHEIDVGVDERASYQRSLWGRGWWVYEQFGIEYLTQPTCEWARFQKWCTYEFILLSQSFCKQEISGQEYIETAKTVYRTMNDFQATYWDKLRQDRLELEYQKWLFAVRKSVREQELPVDMVWDIEAGEVVLSALKATSAESIKRFMEDDCHFPEEVESHTRQWIAHKIGSSKLIFGLSPELRGLAPPPETHPPSEGSPADTGAHGAINDDEAEVSEAELSPAHISPATGIIQGGLWLSKQLGAKKRFNAKRLPPLPNKEPWILKWDKMCDAQKARMRAIHYGENDEYYRPSRQSAPAPNNPHAPGSASSNPIDLDQADQNKDLGGQRDRDGASATIKTRLGTSEESELSDQSEMTSIQQGQYEATAAQSTKNGQPMEKLDSTGSNHPLMIGPNGNGDDDGSKPPSQGGGIPSKGHYKQQSVMVDDDDDDSTALEDVEDNWLDPEVEARVMGGPPASSQRTHAERSPGRPVKNRGPKNPNESPQSLVPVAAQPAAAQPTAEPTAQSTSVREAVLFRIPLVPAPEASPQPPILPQRGTFSDAPSTDILREQHINPLSGRLYNADAGLNVSSTMDPRLRTVVRLPKIERPRIGPRPDNMNQRLNEVVRRASQTHAPSVTNFTPVNRPVPHGQPSPNIHKPDVPAAQVQPSRTPISQSTGPVSVPLKPRSDEPDTGILVRNTDGTLKPASSSLKRQRSQASQMDEGFRERSFYSNGNHLTQQMSSPENVRIPARHSRSASTSETQRSGIPMMPQRSHPGFDNRPRHSQQQGQMNGNMALMQHGGFSQRLPTQSFGNQARGNSYQHPNMMHQVSSMIYTGLSGNTGAGATQIQAPQFGLNGYLGMITSQQSSYAGHTSTLSGNDIGRCPLSNGYSGHRGSQQQSNTLNASGWPNMTNSMDPFASPIMQNSTNGLGIAQASPNMLNSVHGAFDQPSHSQHHSVPGGYGMAQSSPDMHNSMHGNGMAQPPSGLRRRRPSMKNSQQGRSPGMRYGQDVPTNHRKSKFEIQYMGQDQPGYTSPVRTSNNPHSNMQLNGSIDASRIPRSISGQYPNGGPPPSKSRVQPGGATPNNQQNTRTSVGQSRSTDTNQRLHGHQTAHQGNGQPIGMSRRQGRPRMSPPQHPQHQSQNLAPFPAPPAHHTSPRPWTADQSVYNNRPVDTAYGKLLFGQQPPILWHVPPPTSDPPSGTGSLQDIEPIERISKFLNRQVQTTAIPEHQLGVALDSGLSLKPPSSAPADQQPNLNDPAAVIAGHQHALQAGHVPQQEPAITNAFIDPSCLSLPLAPANQDDVLLQHHVPTAPRQPAKQQTQESAHESYGDGMGLENEEFLITPPGSHPSSQLQSPQSVDGGNMYLEPDDDLFYGVNFDDYREDV
jgi:hypothetical protein